MKSVLIFAGTSEGRELAGFCSRNGIRAWVSAATEYGETLIPEAELITRISGYRGPEELNALLTEQEFCCVVDATHPYAKQATEQIRAACETQNVPYYRLLREEDQDVCYAENMVFVKSVGEAAKYLKHTSGNIMVTTGSKELAPYVEHIDRERLFFRVLPTQASLELCAGQEILPKQIIAMQGPFNRELNAALIKQFDCRYLVTKSSGRAGGFIEKLQACADTDAVPVIITRPEDVPGYSKAGVERMLLKHFGLEGKRRVYIAGIGPGAERCMTGEVLELIGEADACIGSGRMLDAAVRRGKTVFDSYRPEEIAAWLDGHPECGKSVVLMSGDPGFYSGTKKLLEQLSGYEVTVLPGISSVSAFCARLGISWDDMFLCSMHGRKQNLIKKIKHHKKVFSLLGKEEEFHELCRKMVEFSMDNVKIFIGDSLSYEAESIFEGTPSEALEEHFSNLCCAVFINEDYEEEGLQIGLPEEVFLRDKVPMTKDEIRSVSIAKLAPARNSVIYDIGAGTGSVSVELALAAEDGIVYAIEKKPLAAELIRKNRDKFCLTNLEVAEGTAPEALDGLPAPTHAFIGGSSGNLMEIVALLKEKNPGVRIVVNAIALETVAEIAALSAEYETEIVQIQTAKAKKAGSYHLMMGQNPVTVALIY